MLPRHVLARVIRTALEEDIGAGDITTGAALNGDEMGLARAIAKTVEDATTVSPSMTGS
jgi:nicotinate-nucleotide pyrophosphorylase